MGRFLRKTDSTSLHTGRGGRVESSFDGVHVEGYGMNGFGGTRIRVDLSP